MILPLALILCFVVGCQDKAAMAELEAIKVQTAVEDQNKATFIRWVEEDEKGNFEIWEEVCSPEYKYHISSTGEPVNLDEHLKMWKMFRKTFPDIKSEIIDIMAKDDKVISRKILRGTHTMEFMGLQPTGKEFEYSAIEIIRFSNGKVVEGWGEGDMLGFYQQLGMELKPKEGEK
jgi:predicted ester cyclase